MRDEAGPLPVALSSEEITENDFRVLLDIANNPKADQGRLKIAPRRIATREREMVNN